MSDPAFAPRLTRRLAEVSLADVASAGGKAASLGSLSQAGIAVPRGFVVLAPAFRSFVAAVDPSGSLARSVSSVPAADVSAIGRAAAGVREVLVAASLPEEVTAAIVAEYQSLGASSEVAVAVRSSATMEDSSEASFAGLQDTYLGVRGVSAVLDRVRACWASLYNDESVAYRRRMGLAEDGLAMGVIIQRMISPRAAGVMFTRSPVTGDRSVVAIEGTWGLGSALVAGDVTPDAFTVSKVTGEITGRRLGAKLRLHSFLPNGSGITVQAMPPAQRHSPCISDDEARALASVGRQVEEHYGIPQDIEWALLGDDLCHSALHGEPADRIVLLQSRPETVWAARSQAPVATPKPRASDHVLNRFLRPL
ncbi:MAG: PEP/pyruvate-binding domain-containing protein [Streptosporangiaceae bacterium]